MPVPAAVRQGLAAIGPMSFPLIADPFFYAVTIPAVLLLGIRKSGFGAGFGSLAVPVMVLAVTVQQAAAILMLVLLLKGRAGNGRFPQGL
jgi:hypothetical protein